MIFAIIIDAIKHDGNITKDKGLCQVFSTNFDGNLPGANVCR